MATILIIEDDAAFREILEAILVHEQHRVFAAADGNQGLALARQHRPDLVITDLLMPEKEGLETIRELRTFKPAPKIIAMSGGGRVNAHDFLSIAVKFGAAQSLEKPFDREQLLRAITVALAA